LSFEPGPDFEALLEFLQRNRGFDFTGYKRSTLLRRVGHRAMQVGVQSFADYLDHLQVHPDEFPILFNTILINVTEFFRDPASWDYLAEKIVPGLVAKPTGEPIRVWSAGCASGEEAYSLAMLLAEALGEGDFVRRVKIYATDVDEEALSAARFGYLPPAMSGVDEKLVAEYFELVGGRYVFKAALRRVLIFGRHDLIQDAPISRLDLLVCRNTLMYFTAESQSRVLSRFHFALSNDGFLFLGKAEMLLTHADLFAPVDLKHRIFSKVARGRDRARVVAQTGGVDQDQPLGHRQLRVRELAHDLSPVAQLTLDADGSLAGANLLARGAFHLAVADIGKPLRDLEVSYRPIELRANIARAAQERKAVAVRNVVHELGDGSIRRYDVEIAPIVGDGNKALGTSITFTDVTDFLRLRGDLERSKQDVETAYEELQSSNEELETTNEELQSAVEELETTNEELQSSNEELETMNEELESTNAELQTINNDLRQRTDEIDRLNLFMESILASLRIGVAVLDVELRVVMWNARAEDLWGVRSAEVLGRSVYDLDIGLPIETLRPIIKVVAAGDSPSRIDTVAATNRRGRAIHCRVSFTPLAATNGRRHGVVILMEETSGDRVPERD
jgi:two-component system CheB/CheR fusion protein